MEIFITTFLMLTFDDYHRAKNAIGWCESKWGVEDGSCWRYSDNITKSVITFEFINEEMKVEFLLTWC